MLSLGTGLKVQSRGIYCNFLTKDLFGYERESGENNRNSVFISSTLVWGVLVWFVFFFFALVAVTGLIKSA